MTDSTWDRKWVDHPEHTVEQWQSDVAEGATRMSYREWVDRHLADDVV
ncbi:hypothetical protein [Gordonia sihwensis]